MVILIGGKRSGSGMFVHIEESVIVTYDGEYEEDTILIVIVGLTDKLTMILFSKNGFSVFTFSHDIFICKIYIYIVNTTYINL